MILDINHFAISFLMLMSNTLGVNNVPPQGESETWNIASAWEERGGLFVFEATSSSIIASCQSAPKNHIEFPNVIQGAHEILVDGVRIARYGEIDFHSPLPFYGIPLVACEDITSGSEVTWRAYTNSQYFARFHYFPRLTKGIPITKIFGETVHIAAGGCLLFMAIFGSIIFFRKVSKPISLALPLSCIFFSIYFATTVASYFGIFLDMLTLQKISDFNLWVGASLFYYVLTVKKLIPKKLYFTYVGINVIAGTIILTGQSVDTVQYGTSLPFTMTFIISFVAFATLVRESLNKGFDKNAMFSILSLGCLLGATTNDMLLVTGIYSTVPVFPIGIVAGFLFLSLSVNEIIVQTYVERDYLRHNLELEVTRKTMELQVKGEELQKAMHQLQITQAELIQNAKLASLGTLSAGIAHEINNSLNYVYGALPALKKMITASESPTLPKALKLLDVMNEGLQLTFNIIKSLKNYSGMNQAKFNDVELRTLFESVMTIIKSKINEHIEVQIDVPGDAKVFGNVVGLNQVFMNLISNAIDAMPQGGKLVISAKLKGACYNIKIEDTGAGIEEANLARIFDPFFTTKDVGSGTGIGLHIVKTEIDKHQGQIQVTSQKNVGTVFSILLPIVGNAIKEAAA